MSPYVDIGHPDEQAALERALAGADAVVHLAWLIQPNHDRELLRRTNVAGTAHVLAAARAAGVRHVVCASSVGAYSPAPKDRRTREDWPAGGIEGSHYSADKAAQESLLDGFAKENPDVVVSRLRPALIFSAQAGSEVGRYFLGRVLERRAAGAFNIAAEPILDPNAVGWVLGARRHLPVPVALLRAVVEVSWRLRLQATDGGWIDMAAGAPLMDTTRAQDLLGWRPQRSSLEALTDVLDGIGAAKAGRHHRRSRPGNPENPAFRP